MLMLPSALIISITFLFIFMWHPMSITILIIFQAMIIAVNLYTCTQTSWFTYILLMAFLSGMMIIFAYISSIVPNETMTKMSTLMLSSLVMMLIILLLLVIMSPDPLFFFSLFLDPSHFPNSTSISVFKIFNTKTNSMAMMLITYLLIVLIMSVKLTSISHGPLRTKK
uniref:NADH dehydrogenase subunit 6 n=1 Tax=Stygobromus indentatus TaxID=1678292 RepID=A0A172QHC2_9CRUS|nr:NADH dehydrogenase subunit 6 [Stygobromus indentatus]AND97089.1 NADH dehydrogenase subunit 6 [Stygobromus indentatus]